MLQTPLSRLVRNLAWRVSAALVVIVALSAVAVAFPIPERLEFDLYYTGIYAGKAIQEVTREDDEIHMVSTARSADWLKVFFPVDDRIESFVSLETTNRGIGLPRLYKERIREGWTRYHKEAVFNRQAMEVITKDFIKKEEKTVKISGQTYDTLSSFFYLRSAPLIVGQSSFVDIFDGKRIWNTEVQVLRREEVETSLGKFQTILVKPMLKHAGIFARTGDMYIWLTDDERRVPVMMKSKVKIGHISAILSGGSYWPKQK